MKLEKQATPCRENSFFGVHHLYTQRANWLKKGSAIGAMSLSVAIAQAASIVDFTHEEGNRVIRPADVESLSGAIWNFSDELELFEGVESVNDSNTRVYGGLKATWNNTAYAPNFQLRGSDNRIQLQVNARTNEQKLKGILLWNKADFLNHAVKPVVFDATSSMFLDNGGGSGSAIKRFVVNDRGVYYVSKTSGRGSEMLLSDPAAEPWAVIDPAADYSIVSPFESRKFTDIQGVGLYLEQRARHQTIFQVTDFQVSATVDYSAPVDIKFANIFGNGSVLQRDQTVPIWGTATAGDRITVDINGQSKQGIADKRGNWRIELDPESAGGPYKLSVNGEVSFPAELAQVYFGDVWIVTGQSNMAQGVKTQTKDLFPSYYPSVPNASDNFEDMRFAIVRSATANEPADDVTVVGRSWHRWRGGALNGMSTVGYFFARRLNAEMDVNGMADVPLGFIKVTHSGTAIEEWISAKKLTAVKAQHPELIISPKASGYYNAMIAPIQDYAIKGAIWYQGENNVGLITRIEQYPILKQGLLDSWREQWRNPELPFYFVQLAPFYDFTPLPEDELWAWMREHQESCLQFPNTGMACIIESGFQGDIHPPFKDRAGERLARIALDRTYGIPTVHRGPTLQRPIDVSGSDVTITFNNVASGLETRAVDAQPDADEIAEGRPAVSVSADELAGFFLCGADKKFYPALEATITASNQVRISNAINVPSPVAVRYAFQNFPRCNLFNSEGLPAEPFRTDAYAFGEALAGTVTADAKRTTGRTE